MSAASVHAPTHPNRVALWVAALVFIALAIAGVAIYQQGEDDQLAESRADKLFAQFKVNGLTMPLDRATVIDVLGSDGGNVCANPSAALTTALRDQQLSNGAGSVGARPTRVDRQLVAGEDLVISVYCPDKLAAYREYVDSNRYYTLVRH